MLVLQQMLLPERKLQQHFHYNRHEAVIFAAKLGADAPVGPWCGDFGPGIVDDTGYRILLPTQSGHPPGVDDIVGRD